MKITYLPYGAQFILTLAAATPQELAQTVNTFANHGMFTEASLPAEYKEEKHTRVTLGVTQTRIMPALRAIGATKLIGLNMTLPREMRVTGADFDKRAEDFAQLAFADFTREESQEVKDAAENGVADLRDYKLDPEDDAVMLRKAAGRIFSGLAKVSRESAKSAPRSKAD